MRRARAGDADAFGALVASHRSSALRVATVVLGSADDADDVVQSSAERAMSALARFDESRPFRPWFLRIVANGARNHRRSRWRRRHAELRLAGRGSDVPDDPAHVAVTESQRSTVVAALNRLGPNDRIVLALRHFEQFDEREMSDVLGCPVGTVKSRLARATQRLRAELVAIGVGDE